MTPIRYDHLDLDTLGEHLVRKGATSVASSNLTKGRVRSIDKCHSWGITLRTAIVTTLRAIQWSKMNIPRKVEKYKIMFLTADTYQRASWDLWWFLCIQAEGASMQQKMWFTCGLQLRLSKSNKGTRYKGRKVIRTYS